MMVYLASYTELTRLSSTNLLIPPRLSSGRINGTAKRRRTGIYFAVISPLSLSPSSVRERVVQPPVSTLRCFAAASLQRKRESWNWKPANRLRNRPALFNFCPIARGCWPVASPLSLSPFSFRFVYFYISSLLATSLLLSFNAHYFALSLLSFSFFSFLFPFAIAPSRSYIVHFLSTFPSPKFFFQFLPFFPFFPSFLFSFTISLYLCFSLSFQRWERHPRNGGNGLIESINKRRFFYGKQTGEISFFPFSFFFTFKHLRSRVSNIWRSLSPPPPTQL